MSKTQETNDETTKVVTRLITVKVTAAETTIAEIVSKTIAQTSLITNLGLINLNSRIKDATEIALALLKSLRINRSLR